MNRSLKIRYLYVLIFLSGFLAGTVNAQSAGENGKENHHADKDEVFDASTFILDHVADFMNGICGQRKTAPRLLFTSR